MGSVLGSILDPAADKLLMTTMVITLAMRDMLPRASLRFLHFLRQEPLAEPEHAPSQFRSPSSSSDETSPCRSRPSTSATPRSLLLCVLPSAASVALRSSDPPLSSQKTFARYWDFSIPSASVHPTAISKCNTFLQLLLVGSTTIAPLLPFELGTALTGMQCVTSPSFPLPEFLLTRTLLRLQVACCGHHYCLGPVLCRHWLSGCCQVCQVALSSFRCKFMLVPIVRFLVLVQEGSDAVQCVSIATVN